MIFVQQRNDWDCVICCIAMWTGETYESIYNLAYSIDPNVAGRGVTGTVEDEMLKRLKMVPLVMTEAWGGVPGILSFPSLNFPGKGHAIFYDGKHLFDPQSGRAGLHSYPKEIGMWPGCYNLTVDLRHPYSLEMAKLWANDNAHRIKTASGEC